MYSLAARSGTHNTMMQVKDVGLNEVSSKKSIHYMDMTLENTESEYRSNDVDLISPKSNRKRMMKSQTPMSIVKPLTTEVKTVESKMPKKRIQIQIPEESKVCVPKVPSSITTVKKAKNSTQKSNPMSINFESIAAIQMKIEDALVKANIRTKPQRSKKEMKIYVCGDTSCDFRANKLVELRQHERKLHAGEAVLRHRCKVCDRVYQSQAHLIRHSVIHSRSNNEVEGKPEVNSNLTAAKSKVNSSLTPAKSKVNSSLTPAKPKVNSSLTRTPESGSNQKAKQWACKICKTPQSFTHQSGLVAHLVLHLEGKVSNPPTTSK